MKRMLPALCLAALLAMGVFSMEAHAMTMEVRPCWQAAPFLVAYTRAGENCRDMGELYSLSGNNTQVLAYRASPGIQPEAGTYALENLEETGEISGRLRAVILGGYPNLSADGLQDRANAWLRGQNKPEVENLQTGEALLATQITLWKLLEPGAFPKGLGYDGWKDLTSPAWAGYRSQVRDLESLTQVPTEHTASNILSLCAYLENLRPIEEKAPLISDAALAKASYEATQLGDGTWRIAVAVPLEETAVAGEALTLKALCGGQEQSIPVEGQQTYSFSFEGLATPRAVMVTLEGIQQGNDVYLLSGESARLLGLVRGQVPVRGQITLSPDRILRISKTSGPEEGSVPLENIQFNLYLAATLEQLQRGEVSLGAEPTAQEAESCQRAENLVAILSTDKNGQASYNFTAGENPDGVYLVVEQFCAGTTGPVDPFYVSIPSEGGYIQELHLENGLETQPELTLSVTQRGRTEDTFGVGQLQTWYIRASIPAGMSAAKTYTLWDLLPEGMDYGEADIRVVLETRAEESLRLVPNIHYSMKVENGELEISLTPAGMAYTAANRGQGAQEPGILVTFEAMLNQSAPLGQPISHRARLSYVNGAGISYSKTSPWAKVETGGFSLRKIDPSGQPLPGNTYRLVRAAGEGERPEEILNVAGVEIPVVSVTFLAGGDIQREAVTNKEGRADFSGLAYGAYYLVEIRGTGEEPVPVLVDRESHQDGSDARQDKTIQLVSTRVLLPDTGGMGPAVLTGMGLLAVLCAGCLLLMNRRRAY